MKKIFLSLILGVGFLSAPALQAAEFSTFSVTGNCLSLPVGTTVSMDAKFLLFSTDKQPSIVTVIKIQDGAFNEPGCALLSDTGSLAIANPPSNFIATGGDKHDMDPRKQSNFMKLVPSKKCPGPNPLIKTCYYGPVQRHQIVEIYLGKPVYLKTPAADGSTIESIRVCKFTYDNTRLMKNETFNRVGLPLNKQNWWDLTDEDFGYVSLNGGVSWKKITK